MVFEVLADHASIEERQTLMRQERWRLLAMGVMTGYLGAAPAAVWAASILTVAFAPLLIAVSVWLYTLLFALSSLWFAHYGLAALERLRAQRRETAVAASGGESGAPLSAPG
jgi:phosphatidylglycerophosphatase A